MAANLAIDAMPEVLWRHPRPEQSEMFKFKTKLEQEKGVKLGNFQELHAWTVHNRLEFWDFCFRHFPLIHEGKPKHVVEPYERMEEAPHWFPGVSINFAENALYSGTLDNPQKRSMLGKEDDKIAIAEVREAQVSHRSISWGQLRDRTSIFAAAMRANGVRPGDRVAVVMNNSLDTLCVFLGATSLGAMFSSSSTDMGATGILERLRQIGPRLVFMDDSALYNGKRTDLRQKMGELIKGMEGLQEFQGLISVPWGKVEDALDVKDMPRTTCLQDFLATHQHKTAKDLEFTRRPFHEGFLIVYSSGTTGTPKCIVHSVGSIILNAYKELSLHRGLNSQSVVQQFTTTGWIMYMASITSLLRGAKVVMYDGSPFYPGLDAFLKLAAQEHVTHLGVSPRWLQTIRTAGIVPRHIRGTEYLQNVGSTGMVLPVELFRWFYSSEGFHPETQLSNLSGGTDLAAAFADCNPLDPITAVGGCQGYSLGFDVQVYDPSIASEDGSSPGARPPQGRELPPGKPGELVCAAAFPNMPAYFWGDKSGAKYRNAYFGRFDNVWVQGDFVQVEPLTRAVLFLGRADGVLNPSGVRFGSAEIYSVLENRFVDSIDDTVCVGQRRPGDSDEQVLLFVKMKSGHTFTESLVAEIKAAIATALSRRHVPAFIFETPEIPATVNGKKVELPIKRIVCGETVTPSGTLANPGCLQFYYQFVDSERMAKQGRSKL